MLLLSFCSAKPACSCWRTEGQARRVAIVCRCVRACVRRLVEASMISCACCVRAWEARGYGSTYVLSSGSCPVAALRLRPVTSRKPRARSRVLLVRVRNLSARGLLPGAARPRRQLRAARVAKVAAQLLGPCTLHVQISRLLSVRDCTDGVSGLCINLVLRKP